MMQRNTAHRLQRFDDANAFLERAGPWLQSAEAENNLILSLAERLRQDAHGFQAPLYMAVLEQESQVTGCALRTPPHKLILPQLPPAALPGVVSDVRQLYGTLPGVIGPEPSARVFAGLWAAATGCAWREGRRSRIYQLRQLRQTRAVAGSLRLAERNDIELIAGWIQAFSDEVDMPTVRARFMAEERVDRRELFLWVDGQPRSMAAWAGRTPSSIRIGFVYTPPDQRGRGYASACTAGASARAFDAGYAYCVLFTDLANPTSNAIYQALGYQPVCDVADFLFDRA